MFARFSFLAQKSISIWIMVWAIRYGAGWDYKLSRLAKRVRWIVVITGYLLAAFLPGPSIGRLVSGFLGLIFLCWPNFAYHLTNLFVGWPTTKGRIVSVFDSGSGYFVSYTFELGSDTFGGRVQLGSDSHEVRYAPDDNITIAYDPLNPDRSRIATV